MANYDGPHYLAPTGSTGNNTHTAVQAGAVWSTAIVEFVVEAIGASPTVTWKIQGSLDNSNWYDLGYVTDASDTFATAARTVTTVSKQIQFSTRPYRYFRLVTSANTNVTYRAELYLDNSGAA